MHTVCKVLGKKLLHRAQLQYLWHAGQHILCVRVQCGNTIYWAVSGNCCHGIKHVAIVKDVHKMLHVPNWQLHVRKQHI